MIYVIKASGKKEQFNPKKIFKTCLKAGASKDFAKEATDKVSKGFIGSQDELSEKTNQASKECIKKNYRRR